MRVLVVEDEEAIAGAIERGLIKQGYEVDVARDGAEALEMAATTNYDVICLDLNLPRVDGIEVCRRLREDRFAGGIIMLTARSSIRERIEGLDQGADDYLVKPFAFSELAARIRAITRRDGSMREPIIETRGLQLDPNTNRCRREGKEIHLTPKEFALLYYLARNEGRAVPQEELLEKIWDEHANPFTQTVKVHMNNLRRKLNDGFEEQLIETIRGKGYVL
ncbi:response regulator transcription factor [Tepidiforma thermophila]|jgi:DNA-binding response OmpR family regulator|uniref:DNA-binding response OmpR family regulator n=1 Tax=Tepidiforma thermophila (strain KCTC 52669 / CGMCC 1.13589 / G233) TaxID=2761530 RepID=A0A2A9HIJ1_TEPT2|nr:response regulator transcription factor [Tepidiforma thermophila]PFG74649.1 DNA-binding response OmpR family regulator [Tepidiforma thermophila]